MGKFALVYTPDGRLIAKVGPDGGTSPADFNPGAGACAFQNHLLIVDSNNSRILTFDENYNRIGCTHIYRQSMFEICTTREGLILVTQRNNKVLILTRDGWRIKEFYSFEGENGSKCSLAGICANSKDEILITNHKNHRVEIFDKDGKFLKMFGSGAGECTRLKNPRGICVDKDDNIFVADSGNNRVCIFTPNGILLQEIPISAPLYLCLMDNRLVVTNPKDFVTIFSN